MSTWKTKFGWRSAIMIKGVRYQAPGTFKHKREGLEWEKAERARVMALLEEPTATSIPSQLLLFGLIERYLDEVQHDRVRRTYDEKRFCLERLYRKMGDVDVRTIQPLDISDFLLERAKARSNNAANKDRKNLKAFFAWVNEMCGILHDPTGPIKKKPHTSLKRRLVPLEHVLKVLEVAEGHDKVLIGAYWHTGARKQEVLRLRWADDIDFENRLVRLGTLKGGTGSMEYEWLAMNDDLYELLRWQYENRVEGSPYVFCHRDRAHGGDAGMAFVDRRTFVKQLCAKAGVPEFNYHDLRHTVARYLNHVQRVGMKSVQAVLRHKRQGTTEIYIGGNYRDTKEAMRLLEIKNLKDSV